MFIEVHDNDVNGSKFFLNVSQIKIIYRQIKPTEQSESTSWIYVKTIDDKTYLVDNDFSGIMGLKHYKEFINKINKI